MTLPSRDHAEAARQHLCCATDKNGPTACDLSSSLHSNEDVMRQEIKRLQRIDIGVLLASYTLLNSD